MARTTAPAAGRGKGEAHGGGCPAADHGGSWDRWTQLTGAVATEVSRLLAEDAAAIRAHRSAAALGEVGGLRAAMLAAAEITDLPARFTVEQQPGQPRLIICDQVSGRQALVPPVRLRGGAGGARRPCSPS